MRGCWMALVLAGAVAGCGGGNEIGVAPKVEAPGPMLSSGNLHPSFETTARMRDQTGQEVDWGSEATQMRERVFTNDPDALARMFRNDEGAVMCQGAAYYLHLKYLRAGYRSFLVGFGNDFDTHVVVIVEVQRRDGSTALVVHDPTFNVGYVDPRGRPLSVFELLTALAERRHADVVRAQGAPAHVEFLMAKGEPPPEVAGYITSSVGRPSDNPLFTSYPATISIEAYDTMVADLVRQHTSRRGLPNDSRYATFAELLYVYKGWPMGDDDAQEAQEMFDRISAHMRKAAGV